MMSGTPLELGESVGLISEEMVAELSTPLSVSWGECRCCGPGAGTCRPSEAAVYPFTFPPPPPQTCTWSGKVYLVPLAPAAAPSSMLSSGSISVFSEMTVSARSLICECLFDFFGLCSGEESVQHIAFVYIYTFNIPNSHLKDLKV